jgi:hypothetical protein
MNRYPGGCRIGNNRSRGCYTCNNWAQNVRRLALNELVRTVPEDWERARAKVEADLYPQVYERWLRDHPEALIKESV